MTRTLAAAFAASFLVPAAAEAATERYLFEATPVGTTYTGFSLLFDDTGDGLLDITEIVAGSFSGITNDLSGTPEFYTSLTQVGTVAGFTSADPNRPWTFFSIIEGTLIGSASNFTYSISRPDGPTSEVPLPAAGWMLLAGLGGLLAMRRRAG